MYNSLNVQHITTEHNTYSKTQTQHNTIQKKIHPTDENRQHITKRKHSTDENWQHIRKRKYPIDENRQHFKKRNTQWTKIGNTSQKGTSNGRK